LFVRGSIIYLAFCYYFESPPEFDGFLSYFTRSAYSILRRCWRWRDITYHDCSTETHKRIFKNHR